MHPRIETELSNSQAENTEDERVRECGGKPRSNYAILTEPFGLNMIKTIHWSKVYKVLEKRMTQALHIIIS